MNWTVDYGDGPRSVELPHAWRQDVPVTWEGPAVYRCHVDVQHADQWLVFDGVSYRAEVLLGGKPVLVHEGIWDAFSVPLRGHEGHSLAVEVRVTKNGGAPFPVRKVLSGFLPYVYNTFGGIYGGVRLVRSKGDPCDDPPPVSKQRAQVEGTKLKIDGRPFFMRGVLSWGWYPELGHTNPTDEEIRQEVRTAKEMGFNTVKFCLWVPRHRFFEILEEEGMFAWLELPLWDPDPSGLDQMERELRRIVLQFRRHSCIIAWTVGCELSAQTTPEFRRRLVQMVEQETGCPLIKDNSGSAEMYGGDLREYGTFDDFHPYCDTHFYPPVLESLRPGARPNVPILLGEFCDFDVHRDLTRLKCEAPYWASADPALNDKGVRWQYDLPRVLAESRWASCDNAALAAASRSKGAWVRRRVMEAVHATPEIAGFVVTGWRHTPVSTSGLVDDSLQPVFDQARVDEWNKDDVLFLVPYRRPPWVHGGNRPGWRDTQCFFEGTSHFKIGLRSARGGRVRLLCRIDNEQPVEHTVDARPDAPLVAAELAVSLEPGEHTLEVKCEGASARWHLWVVPKVEWADLTGWSKHDPAHQFDDVALTGGDNLLTTSLSEKSLAKAESGAHVVAVLGAEGTSPMPFWRECALEFAPGVMDDFADKWHRLWGVATDRALDPDWLKSTFDQCEVHMNRIDTRTYAENPYLVRTKVGKGTLTLTTLRPQGGLGAQPYGVTKNPSGAALLLKLITYNS